MLMWIIVGVLIYFIIGVGIFIYEVREEPLMLYIAIPFLLFYPYYIVKSLLEREG